ncbi:MAG: aminoacetone oxidase family FAD-binding enzyme [Thalassospira sp.]|uniref:TIGR03862 family flavoprotein n=1 Tax=Thalassospira sp. GB04J01 TaxID=1485225 RepID=UPI000C10F208|nr:TIGR03862 family flavoprotein [Thalassospira sp. GB04J01]MBV16151.1 aminoacetone oxidase family FAD-binding enzyme [Thalassospira sp.]|tara:strand:- start:71611 stop:72831 length:1221 start_codon:yes stop_codon:yes gene_type:complete
MPEQSPTSAPAPAPNGKTAMIIGAGPAGLMAAERLAGEGYGVTLYEGMPSAGRKFLMAGKSGLNITHSEDLETFLTRYGASRERLEPHLRKFGPAQIRDWCTGLGIETFVGSSGRVFPTAMKASPLLRAWLKRLDGLGCKIHYRHYWTGWNDADQAVFKTPDGEITAQADITILALGGGSWKRLGSDGKWMDILQNTGIKCTPFKPANCGFDVNWTDHLIEKCAGQPVKPVSLTCGSHTVRGEFVIAKTGVEGSAVYAISATLRDQWLETGTATVTLDLCPDRTLEDVTTRLTKPRSKNSLGNHLRKTLGLDATKTALIFEVTPRETLNDLTKFATAIKALPIKITKPRPIDEAISTAGGVAWEELDETFQLKNRPGTYCLGEMVDWEAPTGGYLLSGCLGYRNSY